MHSGSMSYGIIQATKQGNDVLKIEVVVFAVLAVLFIVLISQGDALQLLSSLETRHHADNLTEGLAGILFAAVGIGVCSTVRDVKHRAERKKLEQVQKQLNREKETVHYLTGIIPICSCCKRIRDEKGSWQTPDMFIQNHCEIRFTHSICPQCLDQLYPDYQD